MNTRECLKIFFSKKLLKFSFVMLSDAPQAFLLKIIIKIVCHVLDFKHFCSF